MQENKEYVLGFVFDQETKGVLLIFSNKFGKWNGLGGKIETGESPTNAMYREAKEEAGLDADNYEWDYVGKLIGSGYTLHILRAFMELDKNFSYNSPEGLVLFHYGIPDYNIDNDTKWLAEMCLSQTKCRLEFEL